MTVRWRQAGHFGAWGTVRVVHDDYQPGSPEDFDRLYRNSYGRVLRTLMSVLRDRHAAEDVANYHVERWNYHWSGEYGSKHWSVAHPDREGQDPMPVAAASLSDDGRSVFLRVADLKPVMQMQLTYRLRTAAGEA